MHFHLAKAAATALLAATACVVSAPASAAAQGQTYNIPDGSKPQTVMIVKREIAPGQSVGRHIHHGVEMTYVGAGELTMLVDGFAPHTYHAGDSFVVPRETPHDAKNTGATTTTIYVTYVIDRGTPARAPAP